MVAISVPFLSVPVFHDEPRAGRRLNKNAPLRHHGNRLVRLSIVMNQDSEQLTATPFPNVHGDIFDDVVKRALAHEHGRVVVAKRKLLVLEGSKSQRLQIESQPIGCDGDEQRHDDGWNGQRELTQSRRFHDDDFTVKAESVVGVQDPAKQRDGQYDGKNARQQQNGEVEEMTRREPAIYDQINEPQALGQPDNAHQRHRDKQDGQGELAQDVARQAVHMYTIPDEDGFTYFL